jgi:phosphotransacetylase
MHADTAVVDGMLTQMFPFNRLGGSANVLIFPSDLCSTGFRCLPKSNVQK